MGLTFLGVVAVRYALHVYIVISLIKKKNYMHIHMYRYICAACDDLHVCFGQGTLNV